MPNEKYRQGYRLENDLVNKLLEEHQWPIAIRSAGSHSLVDVIGVTSYGITYLFQCKSTLKIDMDLTSLFKDAKVIALTMLPDDCVKCIVIRQKRKRGMLLFRWNKVTKQWHPTNI